MPLTQVFLKRGKPVAYRRAVLEGLYEAMRESFNVPEDDRFMVVVEVDPENLLFGRTYLGIERSEDILIIQVTANDTRDLATKQAFYARVAAKLTASPGVRPEDIFISLVEVAKENWSFGLGIAQYAAA